MNIQPVQRNSDLIHTAILTAILLILLSLVAGCGGSDDPTIPAAVPEVIKRVDDLLAKPYSEHFKNEQSDYASANHIADAIQNVIDQSEFRSKTNLMGLISDAEYLVKRQTEDNYQSLINEWKAVRSQIKLKQ